MAGFGLGNYINPGVGSFIDRRRNALAGLGAGLLNGQPGSGVQSGLAADQDYAQQQKTEAEQLAERNQTSEWIKANFPQYSNLPPAQAWQAAMGDLAAKRAQGPAEPLKGISINDRLVNPITGQLMGDFSDPPERDKPPAAPAGYRYGQDGNLAYIPGGPADPSTAGKTTEATRRNQQLAKVMLPEAQALLGDGTNPGLFDSLANGGDQLRAGGGDLARIAGLGPSAEYQQAQNSLKTIIASYLYSVSGATANPGEVETQASVLTPRMGESAQSVAAKKARVQQMVEAVAEAAKGVPIDVGAPGGQDTSGVVDYSTYFGDQ